MPTHSVADVERPSLFAHLDALERLLQLASKLSDSPRATLSRAAAAGIETIAWVWPGGAPEGLLTLDEHVLRAGGPLLIADLAHDGRFAGSAEWLEHGVRAYAGVPLVGSSNDTIGVLAVRDVRARRWGPETVSVLTEMAWLAGHELERAAMTTRIARAA